jgi:hypothetical protein
MSLPLPRRVRGRFAVQSDRPQADPLTPARARAIGGAARRRVLAQHTYDRRAREVDALFRTALRQRRT